MAILHIMAQVQCLTCGGELHGSGTSSPDGLTTLALIPCQTCLNRANDAGYGEGHAKGFAEGRSEREGVA